MATCHPNHPSDDESGWPKDRVQINRLRGDELAGGPVLAINSIPRHLLLRLETLELTRESYEALRQTALAEGRIPPTFLELAASKFHPTNGKLGYSCSVSE